MHALLMPKPKSAVPNRWYAFVNETFNEGLYPVLIVMCVHCIVSQEHQIPVEYNAAPNV
jgi:hypothetical protein